MLSILLGAGLVLALALLIAIHGKLAELPLRIRRQVERDRAADEARALTTLQEAAAARVGTIVLSLRQCHEALEAYLRSDIAQSETRARVCERRSSDAGVALGAASALVSELRGILDDLPRLGHARASPAIVGAQLPEPEDGADASRVTVEISRAVISVEASS
jgi:hypothetical protein